MKPAATVGELVTAAGWPAPDVAVLRNRPLQPGTTPQSLSRFADSVWSLTLAHADAHVQVNGLHWATYPPPLRLGAAAAGVRLLNGPGGTRTPTRW